VGANVAYPPVDGVYSGCGIKSQ